MTTKRETVLAAAAAMLDAATTTTVQRNGVVPEDVAASGLVVLADGEPGEPSVSLSPPAYLYSHRAAIEIYVQDVVEADRRAAADDIAADIGVGIAADRTLGGACDWIEAEAPVATEIPVEGGAPILALTVALILVYVTSDPLA